MKRPRIKSAMILIAGIILLINIDHVKAMLQHADIGIGGFWMSDPLRIEAEAAILIDEQTGEVIYAKNETKRLYPASTTKLLTALVALENLSPNETVSAGNEVEMHTPQEARAGLFYGQKLTVSELVGAMLVPSGNDAARTLAVFAAKKHSGNKDMQPEEGLAYFAELMNEKAKELGAVHSRFSNPHGLHDNGHYSTASDLALIAKAAREQSLIREVAGSSFFAVGDRHFPNRNLLLNPEAGHYYEGATGLKTGFTDEAGYCLVSSAERSGRKLIAVVLHSSKDSVWQDSAAVLDYGFGKAGPAAE